MQNQSQINLGGKQKYGPLRPEKLLSCIAQLQMQGELHAAMDC